MTIIAPKNGRELEKALEFARKYNGPIAIRFSRGKASNVFENLNNELVMGKSETLIEGETRCNNCGWKYVLKKRIMQ